MFTGIVETIGHIQSIEKTTESRRLEISAVASFAEEIAVNDSIAVDGVCLTATEVTATSFVVTAVPETLRKTTVGLFETDRPVNLEQAMRLGGKVGGHLVQGHVDCTTVVTDIVPNQAGIELWIAITPQFRKYVNPVGSICLNGVSLTIAECTDTQAKLAIIPHTLHNTTLGTATIGQVINVEFDMLAKYLETLVRYR
jgi:riboflavin synthase